MCRDPMSPLMTSGIHGYHCEHGDLRSTLVLGTCCGQNRIGCLAVLGLFLASLPLNMDVQGSNEPFDDQRHPWISLCTQGS
ncbi:MAG TPA: hypothetical protein VHT72_04175 [Puia sp.]|nr:hypothetical protein [Puia sp.]